MYNMYVYVCIRPAVRSIFWRSAIALNIDNLKDRSAQIPLKRVRSFERRPQVCYAYCIALDFLKFLTSSQLAIL